MDSARTGLRRLLERYASWRVASATELGDTGRAQLDAAVCADLNTAEALALVAAASRDGALSDAELSVLAREFDAVLAIGLADLSPRDLDLKRYDVTVADADVEVVVAERTTARTDGNYAKSDQLCDQLMQLGAIVDDDSDGTTSWRWAQFTCPIRPGGRRARLPSRGDIRNL